VVVGYKFPYDFAGPCQKTLSPLRLRAKAEPAGEEMFLVSVDLRSALAAPAVVVRMATGPGVEIVSATPEVPSEPLPVIPGVPSTWTLLVRRAGPVGGRHGNPLHPEVSDASATEASAILITARYSPGPGAQWATAAAAHLGPPAFAPPPGRPGRMPDGSPAWLLTVGEDR